MTFRIFNTVARLSLCVAAISALPVAAQDRVDFESAIQTDQAVAPEACLSFKTALRLAAANNPNVSIAQSDLEAARAGLTEAKSLRRPQVSVFTRSGIGDEGLVNSTIANQVGLRASQRIFDFGDSRLAREAAEQEILAQESLILGAEARARLEAGLAYIDWLDATERLMATVERGDYFLQELSALKIALESGGATRSEVAEISAESADAEADRFELEFERQQAISRLRIATRSEGLPCPNARASVERGVDVLSGGESSLTYLGDALVGNAQVQALTRTASQLELEAERQSRSRLPVIEIVGISSLTTDRRFNGLEARERIGFDASVPIFTGSALTARTNRARAEARRAEFRADEERKTLEEQVTSTHKRALLLSAQLGRRQAVIEFRTEEFEAAQTGYENNIRTLPEMVDIRLALEEARLAEIRTRHNYFRQGLTLKSLTGALQ